MLKALSRLPRLLIVPHPISVPPEQFEPQEPRRIREFAAVAKKLTADPLRTRADVSRFRLYYRSDRRILWARADSVLLGQTASAGQPEIERRNAAPFQLLRHSMARSSCPKIRRLFVVLLLPALALLCSVRTAHAFAHLWEIKEVFSNADGSVQFIEMFDNFTPEQFITNQTLTATSTGPTKTFTFSHDITTPPQTNGRHLLIATPGFQSLPGGVLPDYFLPDPVVNGPFFDPSATTISITFSASFDEFDAPGATFPKNGINSLTDTTVYATPTIVSGVNSPTNYAGQSGSVNLSSPSPTGDYNGNHLVDAADYIVWRNTKNQSASPNGSGADGNSNGTIDDDDYTFWRSKFGNAAGSGSGQSSPIPEPAAAALLLAALIAGYPSRQMR